MSDWVKLLIGMLGIFLVTAGAFYSQHPDGPFNHNFWIGFFLSACVPVGTYLGGLFQDKPFQEPKP